jgi:predicted nucleotidyltransferase
MIKKITDFKLKIIGLYKSNYLSSYYIREMAKLLGTSHVALLPHLLQLEKDKVLLKSVAGKNKSYALNLANILTKEYIVMAEKLLTITYLEKSFLIKKIYSEIQEKIPSASFVLFGSFAKKTENKESDIDLLCISKEEPDVKFLQVYTKKISVKTVSEDKFLTAIRNKDSLIIEIIKYHILLTNSEIFINGLWRHYNDIKQA